MNDLLYLTFDPSDGGNSLPWKRVQPLITAMESAFAAVAKTLDNDEIRVVDADLFLVGSPVAGSLRFNLRLQIKSEPTARAKRQRRSAIEPQSLLTQVGINALGGIVAASFMLAAVGKPEDPAYGAEQRLRELCAQRARQAVSAAVDELELLAQQSGCTSVRLQYESFPPLELSGQIEPLKLKIRSGREPPDRVHMFVSAPKSVIVYLGDQRMVGYFVQRLDDNSEALALFARPVPQQNINDRMLVRSRLYSRGRKPLYVSKSVQKEMQERLGRVRSVLIVEETYGVMRQ